MATAVGDRRMLPFESFVRAMQLAAAGLLIAAPAIVWPHAHDALVFADGGQAAGNLVAADPISRVTEWALQQGVPTVLLLAVMILLIQSVPRLLKQVQSGYEDLEKVQKEKLQLMHESFRSVQEQHDRQLRMMVDELRDHAVRHKETIELLEEVAKGLRDRPRN